MAKYKRTYENETVKHELTFRGETFGFNMVPDFLGRRSDKECIEYQINEKYPEISVDALENIGIDMLYGEDDEDTILDTLNLLSEYE